jgi:hypothetical protein
MPEIKKRRIVIASVLKPVNDIRMTEKIARSLSDTRQFELHIIGVNANDLSASGLVYHPHPLFERISLTRILMPWRIFQTIRALRPALLIIATHELILPALLLKTLTRCKIAYDVQENYYRNILHTPAFPLLVRPFLALYVRMKELISTPFIDHFFLAEKAYVHELRFTGNRATVLENKLKKPDPLKTAARKASKLLFSGTLAETTGVFRAIEIAVRLHALDNTITLTLAGYCPQQSTLAKIKKALGQYSFIRLLGGDELVPHSKIIACIMEADAGIIAYPDNPSTVNSVPTKLYEYLGLRLPVLLTYHPVWTKICLSYSAAIVFDPERINEKVILDTLKKGQFYTSPPTDVFWESEEPRLIRQVLHLLQ